MEEKMKNNKGFILKATPRAFEKLKEIVNGSQERVNEFIKKVINEGIDKKDYQIFLKNKEGEFYYYKCGNLYVIFDLKDKIVTLVDFITEIEFKEMKDKNSNFSF